MEKILITDLSNDVLLKISETSWSKKYRDHLRCQGIKPMLRYFDEKNMLYYDKHTADDFVMAYRKKYDEKECIKLNWQAVRKCSAFMSQVYNDGCISTKPLCKWTSEEISLFRHPDAEDETDLENIHTLVYRTREAFLLMDLSEKTKKNFTYDGFADVLRYFKVNDEPRYSEKLLNMLEEESYIKYLNSEIDRSKYHNIRKIISWVKEYHETSDITYRELNPYSFRYTGNNYEMLISEYSGYSKLRDILKPSSITVYSLAVRRFFRQLEDVGIMNYSDIKLPDVVRLITASAKIHPHGINSIFNALRSFAAFIIEKHPELPDISPALIGIPAKHHKIYEGYTLEESKKVLDSIDRNTVIGKRDYAMMMLAFDTGLRGIDITNLTLRDICWNKSEVSLIQEKTGVPLALPFTVDTGNAIADYILNARQSCEIKYIFLRMQRPYTKLASGSVYTIFSKYAIPVLGDHISIGKKHGPHAFRRGLGARMLDAGVSSSVMSDVFGHETRGALTNYTAVSLKGLRICAGSLNEIPVTCGELL